MTQSRSGRLAGRKFVFAIGMVLVLVIVLRIMLPTWVRNYVNRTLARIPGYKAQVADIDIALIRGAYIIKDLKVSRVSGRIPVPLVDAPVIDLSIEWGALFHGKIVGEIYLEHPSLTFVNGTSDSNSQLSVDEEWLKVVKDLFPFRIDRFEIGDGNVHFRDFSRQSKVDVKLTHVGLIGLNFSNTRSPSEGKTAQIRGAGTIEDHAQVRLSVELAPAEPAPTFDLRLSLRDLRLSSLNDFLQAYADFDAEGGVVSVDTELHADRRSFHGYVKPLIHDAKIFKLKKDASNPLRLVWEALVGFLAEVFENKTKEQIGTRIEFSGTFENPQVKMWSAILGVFRNAFVQALNPGLEQHPSK